MFCVFGPSRSEDDLAWIELEEAAERVRPFVPDGAERRAKVVRVLDGETIQAVVKNGDQIESHRVRLTGSESAPECDPGRCARLKAKLAEDDGCCFITLGKEDEFGRRLGSAVTRKGENLFDYLNRMAALEHELAVSGLIPLGVAPLGVAPLGVAPLGVAPLGVIVSESKS
jgi:hypothetical protein